MSVERDDANATNRWIIGGGVALLAAAAIGLFVLTNDSSESTATAPSPTTEDTEGTATTEAPASEAPTTTTTMSTTTSAVPPEPADLPAALTTAGSFGVTVTVSGGSESLVITEPMAFATTADDGRVFAQRSTASNDPDADTTPLVWSPDTNELTPLDPPLAAESNPDDTIRLHDVATVDGDVTLLYETRPSSCSDPNECIGAIMAWEPDTGESTEVDSRIVFEGGYSGLELAGNGLIVGTENESATNGIFLAAIGSATPPTPGDLGLEEFYFDCNVCPFAYTIDPSGRFIGWVDAGEGVNQENVDTDAFPSNEIAVVDISDDSDFAQQRVVAEVSAAFGVLDIADIVFGDGGFADGQAVFRNGGTDADNNPLPPVKVDLTSGEIGAIDAVSATLNELDDAIVAR